MFNTENVPQTLVCLLYGPSAKILSTVADILSSLLISGMHLRRLWHSAVAFICLCITDTYKLKFEEIGGVHAVLNLLKATDVSVRTEAFKIVTKLVQNGIVTIFM